MSVGISSTVLGYCTLKIVKKTVEKYLLCYCASDTKDIPAVDKPNWLYSLNTEVYHRNTVYKVAPVWNAQILW